jgi:HAD superfamily hydrolase (TIGR01549 family)
MILMLKAIFIDLDNTMALFDELVFLERFFILLYKRFDDLFAFEDLQNRIIMATLSLSGHNGKKTNRDRFVAHVVASHEVGQKEFWQRSMAFYENEFDQARPEVKKPEKLHSVLRELKQMGLRLIVASNPIYPCIAIEKRLVWVDVDPNDFELVTHMENMNFVKPDRGYYRQICNRLGVLPEHCLMVGNDPRNDMAAAGINIKTYLTTDGGTTDYGSLSLQDDQQEQNSLSYKPGFKGPLSRVIEVVTSHFKTSFQTQSLRWIEEANPRNS